MFKNYRSLYSSILFHCISNDSSFFQNYPIFIFHSTPPSRSSSITIGKYRVLWRKIHRKIQNLDSLDNHRKLPNQSKFILTFNLPSMHVPKLFRHSRRRRKTSLLRSIIILSPFHPFSRINYWLGFCIIDRKGWRWCINSLRNLRWTKMVDGWT